MVEVQWPLMTVERWAESERRVNGAALVQVEGTWWRRVRGLFYRPLNLLETFSEKTRGPSSGLVFGAIQFPVARGEAANSSIRTIQCVNARTYSADHLASPIQRNLKKARRTFQIQPIVDRTAFEQGAYSVYCEFQARTQYEHLRERVHRDSFQQWTGRLFEFPELRFIGAFESGSLCAVAITFRLQDTLHYASYFGNERALANRASDLVLHSVRESAAQDSGIRRVFAATAGMPRGLDSFYLRRGFQYLDLPAVLRGNRLSLALLRWIAPRVHSKLVGAGMPSGPGDDEPWRSESANAVE